MLGMKNYTRDYLKECRLRVDNDLAAYHKQVGKSANKDFEARFFNAEVLLLDYMFVHRLSGIEGKDGNPLNEVRVLCNSLLFNKGKLQVARLPGWPMSAVSGLTLPPEKSILQLKPGDDVRVTEAAFVRLCDAFFKELTKRYG